MHVKPLCLIVGNGQIAFFQGFHSQLHVIITMTPPPPLSLSPHIAKICKFTPLPPSTQLTVSKGLHFIVNTLNIKIYCNLISFITSFISF